MRNFFKKTISIALAICSLFTIACFSSKAADDESILADTSLYLLKDNLIYEVSVNTTLKTFTSNLKIDALVYKANGNKASDNDIISTGCYFNANNTKYTVIVAGDVDGNSIIDSTDYLKIKSFFLGTTDLDDNQFKAADIDNSNIIDSADYLKIKSSLIGKYLLSSSVEYMERKSLVSDILSASNLLMKMNELNANFSLETSSNVEALNLNGSLLANNIGTEKPNFSFKIDANASTISLPISESHYYNGTLYSVNNGQKYKVDASYADVSEYLSNYVAVSPVNSEGKFIIIPQVDRDKILGENYSTISSIIKTIKVSLDNGYLKYNFKTDNILHTNVFYEMFMQSNLASSFKNMNIRDIFDEVYADGTFYINTSGILDEFTLVLDLRVKDSAVVELGVGTPKQLDVAFNVQFNNIGGSVTITPPDASQYTTIDNIYTQFAFSAYDKIFGVSSAISAEYKETLTIDKTTLFLNATTNIKNVENGIELSRKTVISGASTNTEDLYIGNSKLILSTNGNKTTTALNTTNLTVDKTALFAFPHYDSVGNISDIEIFKLTENTDSYTLNYNLTKDYALSLMDNSLTYPYMESKLGIYSSSEYTLKSATGSLTYDKDNFEVLNHSVIVSFALSNGSTVSYSFTFETKSTDYSSVSIDKTLAQ